MFRRAGKLAMVKPWIVHKDEVRPGVGQTEGESIAHMAQPELPAHIAEQKHGASHFDAEVPGASDVLVARNGKRRPWKGLHIDVLHLIPELDIIDGHVPDQPRPELPACADLELPRFL